MKAYACPRCLTLSSTTPDGDGGPHTCTPTPFARALENQIDSLQQAGAKQARRADENQKALRVMRGWIERVLNEVPAKYLPGDLDLCILDRLSQEEPHD